MTIKIVITILLGTNVKYVLILGMYLLFLLFNGRQEQLLAAVSEFS